MNGPSLGFGMAPRTDLTQVQTPQMILSSTILRLSISDLLATIDRELQENPCLEEKENFGETEEASRDSEADGPRTHSDSQLDRPGDWENHHLEEHSISRGAIDEAGDRKLDQMANIVNRPQSLQDHLAEQLGEMQLDEGQRRLARHICSFIDRTGYLGSRVKVRREHKGKKRREQEPEHEVDPELENEEIHDLECQNDEADQFLTEREREKAERVRARERENEAEVFRSIPLSEIAALFDPPATVEDVEDTLVHVVQTLDPPGVGARDLRECLLRQLTPDTPLRDTLHILIRDHLEDIANNRIPVIQKATRFDIPTIREAIAELRRLDPKPGLKFADTETRYVSPDVIVERDDDGTFSFRLTDDWIPKIRISKQAEELLKARGLDEKAKEELRKRLHSAQWLVQAIEQRRETLLNVTRAIIEHQRLFLDAGPEYIQPLKMQQIADQVKLHTSTISRAVAGKWVQTPRGVLPLRRFFGGGKVNNQTGEDVAYEVMKQKLMELIGNEDKANPLSDEELVSRMNEAGHPVARRTITKYRMMLDIPSSRQRKDHELSRARAACDSTPLLAPSFSTA